MAESKPRQSSKQKERQQQTYVRVAIPEDLGGGFITLRCDPNTDEAELKRQALAKIKAKRMTQAYSAMPASLKTSLKVQDSRINLIIPKRRAPRIEKIVRRLLVQTKVKKNKNVSMTFNQGPIGIMGKGNYVTEISPHSQAANLGVCEGWRVLAVNGIPVTTSDSIGFSIAQAHKLSPGLNNTIRITFAPGSMKVGSEIMLNGLKTHAVLNGKEAVILGVKGDEKYDVELINSKNKTIIRGIHGTYLQLKHKKQYWRVISPCGVRIKKTQDKRADTVGTLHYGTSVLGQHIGNWVKHDKGFSYVSHPQSGKEYLTKDNSCKFGIVWPLNLIRKELYFQICKDYEDRRVDLALVIQTATKRQRKLEEQDSKKKPAFSKKQWKKFWKRQNPQFAAYYRRLYNENKHKMISSKPSEEKSRASTRESDILSFKNTTPEENIYGSLFEEDPFEEDNTKDFDGMSQGGANPFPDTELDLLDINSIKDYAEKGNDEDLLDFMSM